MDESEQVDLDREEMVNKEGMQKIPYLFKRNMSEVDVVRLVLARHEHQS